MKPNDEGKLTLVFHQFNHVCSINEKRPAFLQAFFRSGDSAGIRTQDPILKRDVLYQLSY